MMQTHFETEITSVDLYIILYWENILVMQCAWLKSIMVSLESDMELKMYCISMKPDDEFSLHCLVAQLNKYKVCKFSKWNEAIERGCHIQQMCIHIYERLSYLSLLVLMHTLYFVGHWCFDSGSNRAWFHGRRRSDGN